MHCKNCANKIENAINDVSYLACEVNLKENLAIVTGNKTINEGEVKRLLKNLDMKLRKLKMLNKFGIRKSYNKL